jgi:hypothetical protein
VSEEEEEEEEDESVDIASAYTRPVPLHRRGLGGQLVQRMTGAMRYGSARALECPVSGRHCNAVALTINHTNPLLDWRTETADFYSTPEDAHFSSSHEGAPRAIPFCTATCRSEWLN